MKTEYKARMQRTSIVGSQRDGLFRILGALPSVRQDTHKVPQQSLAERVVLRPSHERGPALELLACNFIGTLLPWARALALDCSDFLGVVVVSAW